MPLISSVYSTITFDSGFGISELRKCRFRIWDCGLIKTDASVFLQSAFRNRLNPQSEIPNPKSPYSSDAPRRGFGRQGFIVGRRGRQRLVREASAAAAHLRAVFGASLADSSSGIASISKLFRDYGITRTDQLLSSLILAIPDELSARDAPIPPEGEPLAADAS